jgi:hypothetical protein
MANLFVRNVAIGEEKIGLRARRASPVQQRRRERLVAPHGDEHDACCEWSNHDGPFVIRTIPQLRASLDTPFQQVCKR